MEILGFDRVLFIQYWTKEIVTKESSFHLTSQVVNIFRLFNPIMLSHFPRKKKLKKFLKESIAEEF